MTLDQAMARTGCLQCIPAHQLWALLVLNQAQLVIKPPSCFTLICVDDGTLHEVCCVKDQGQYTLEPTQAAGGSNPLTGITFTSGDATNHVLRLVLDQGFYTIDVVQTHGGTGAIGALPIYCVEDNSTRSVTVILDQGFYTWNIA